MARLGKAIEPISVEVIRGKDKHKHPRWELHIKIGDGVVHQVIPKYVSDLEAVKRELEWLFLGEWEDS